MPFLAMVHKSNISKESIRFYNKDCIVVEKIDESKKDEKDDQNMGILSIVSLLSNCVKSFKLEKREE